MLPTLLAREHDPVLVGEDHGLNPVAQPELHQHACDVGLDRLIAHHQLGGDLGVAQPAREQQQDLALARGQLRKLARRGDARRRPAKEAITRRVTAGASSASPAATVRIARTSSSGGADFSRNPLVPARSARNR